MIPQTLRDLVSVRVFRRHLRQRILKDAETLGPRVAVVAVWPRYSLRMSVRRLLNALREENWSIVLVMNESPDLERVVSQWADVADVVIRRSNIGRDFGAYQSGYSYLRKRSEYSKFEKLAFFNDSVLYPPRFSSILPELLGRDSPVAGFFLNNHLHVHFQSFAVVLSAEVVQSPQMASFWSSYFPSNIRRYAIHRGEIRLSQLVLQTWQDGDVVVTYDRLMSAQPELVSLMSTADRLALTMSVEGGARLSKDVFLQQNSGPEYVDALVREALSSRNVSHSLGLLTAKVLAAPLKLDLMRQGICTTSDFRETLVSLSMDQSEISEVMRMMVARGTFASIGPFERQKMRFGLSG